ncbi:LemA family protein [bacterium]|nr:LemA family protein [bacterium]MBU1026069.1 LemA family protein [bacterium]
MVPVYIIIGIIVLIIFWWIGVYNSLVVLKNRIENAWGQIDVQLKRRYDLIPNIVETVKGYAKHERETFENVVKARQMGMNASNVQDQATAENMITGALKSIFALAEAYPDLKANENFKLLQEELAGTESKIAYARQHYNDSVMLYNTKIQQFPASIVANASSFAPRDFFELMDEAAREAPKVQF